MRKNDDVTNKNKDSRGTKSSRVNIRHTFKGNRVSLNRLFYVLKPKVSLLTAVMIISIMGYYGVTTANSFLERPIKTVLIDGDFEYLSRQSVKALIDEHMEDSFIKEDLLSMRNKLMMNPWIDSVLLRREWPDILHVSIKEQRAIARWGDKGFVNFRGDVVLAKNDAMLNYLPLLRSDDSQAKLLMRQYQFVSELLNEYQLTVLVLERTTVGIWQAELNNGWTLFLGRADINKKLQRLLVALDQEAILLSSAIDSIDLRYENGLSVKWINNDDLGNATVSASETRIENEKNI